MTRTVDADEVPSGPELDDLDDGSEAATDEPAEVDISDPFQARRRPTATTTRLRTTRNPLVTSVRRPDNGAWRCVSTT